MEQTLIKEGLFNNAKFGDAFRTRDNRLAIYYSFLKESTSEKKHLLILGWGYDGDRAITCTEEGWSQFDAKTKMFLENSNDIVRKES